MLPQQKWIDQATNWATSRDSEPKEPPSRGSILERLRAAGRSVLEGVVELGPGTAADGAPAMRQWLPAVEITPIPTPAANENTGDGPAV